MILGFGSLSEHRWIGPPCLTLTTKSLLLVLEQKNRQLAHNLGRDDRSCFITA